MHYGITFGAGIGDHYNVTFVMVTSHIVTFGIGDNDIVTVGVMPTILSHLLP